ncbi:drebrin [Salarias fasciatus]|uniref:drebrin n=1 Tax=Salarias fasciatus TaxID=181472 RepID=UPI0011770A7B|nr:drebrin-like [Salarias fasciatus]
MSRPQGTPGEDRQGPLERTTKTPWRGPPRTPGEDHQEPLERTTKTPWRGPPRTPGEDHQDPLERTTKNPWRGPPRPPGEDHQDPLERTTKNPWRGPPRTPGEDRQEPLERTTRNPWRGPPRTPGEDHQDPLERTTKTPWRGPPRTPGEDRQDPLETPGQDRPEGRALYTYEDDSDDLTLASSGGGGLPEISLTFDSSRVMYGFCSLKEPNAALPRFILINWVGDDVPDARKCACASHVATIADFFQGVEVTVNASSLEDVDPSAIGQRLTNGSAAAASPVLIRLRTREDEQGDVGTVYQKTNAEVEMKKINREEFWEAAKREEELRKEEERRKVVEERQRFEEERMELEKKEQENRERRYREREQQIEEHRKKMQEEEEARERLRNQTTIVTEPSLEDLNLDKKESEVEEAKAIIAQRSGNPREFFKLKERAMTFSGVSSPVSVHRTGGDSHDREASLERSTAAAMPVPRIITTPIREDVSRSESDLMPKKEQKPPVQESTPTKPVQSVAPQTRRTAGFNAWESGTDSLVDLWDSSSAPQTSDPPNPMSDMFDDETPPAAATGRPRPLLSFDDVMDGTFCSGTAAEDDPSSLVDVTGSEQMTLSYQHALQHASGEGRDLDDGQLLMTNGETLLKEGTQASEGYFSQSQEEEFGQSEESSAKPAAVFYNKPPEIDITCWDTDPVDDEDD